MNNGEYWQKRFELLEQAAHQQGVQCYADIEKQYRQAQKQLEGQIAAWYQRFASNNGVTLAEAKRMLNAKELAELKWDVNQYIQYGQENAINGTWVKQLENASARFHISRLEALKLQTQQSIEVMFGNQLDSIDSTMRNVYKSGYYHTAYEIQKGVGIGWDFSALDDKQISKVINKPWAVDGKNFSERIWGNRQKLVNELNNTLTQNIILGKDPQKAIDEIARKMNTSKTNAGRLVMTEEAFFSSAAQKDCFTELDVEQFEIVATLDSHTSDICRGMDGKHFKMSEWKVGETAPPFHVHCRSTTVPYFDDEFDAVGERAARNEETGKTYFVPGNMTYKEWDKAFVQGDKSDLQEINPDDTIKTEEQNFDIEGNTTKLKGAMSDKDYAEYLARLNNHSNDNVKKLYSSYADKIAGVKKASSGAYTPASNSLTFSYPDERYIQNGKDKYSTVAHEYGHFFDAQAQFSDLHFNEIDTVKNNLNYTKSRFTNRASSSDEFLAAVRKDKQFLRDTLTDEIKKELRLHDASDGVQDAIDGLLWERIGWGHGDKYYNRLYHSIKQMKEHKGLQQAYKDLGYDVSNLSKVVSICRDYESASEMWANIMAAEVNGGEALEYVKKYLPNSYAALIEILKGVK
jgi:SPP1 gp7 family putative phage head morphogenesis protein